MQQFISDHPDNHKIEKRSSGEFSPVECRRQCTDVFMFLVLVCSWAAMTGVGLAAMGIIDSKLIKKGDPRRFVNGMDYQGNLCGITNYITPGGEDTVNLPKAYPMPSGYLVCVDSCPKDTNYDKFICEYHVKHEIDNLFGTSEMAADEVDESKKSVYVFYASRKQCMPQVESVSFLGYCIPKLNEVILRTANSTLTDSSDSSSKVSIAIANKESSSSSDFFDKAMSDVMSVRYVIFGFGCGMSLVLGMMFLTIIKVPGVLHMLIWSAVIAINVGLVAAGYHSKGVSAKWAADDIRPRNEATALFYASYVLYGLACVWTIVILFLRKRIMLAISCVREAAKAIGSMPMITLFPGLQVLGLVAFTVVWGLYMAFLASSGDIVARCICHAEDGNTTLFEVETVESKDGLCNEGCLAHKEFKYTTNTKYAALYLIFVWLWTSQFIVAMGQLVVSLAISLWYFNRNRRLVNNATFFRAFFLAATYHLGTAAFGSLVIAIVKTISAVLSYVQNKAAKSKLRVAVVLLSVLKCLLWCFEKVLKYINAQAYVQTAIFGYSFCKASKKGFFLILRNALRISAVAVVSRIVVFVGKIFITMACAVGGYHYLDIHFGTEMNYLMLPTALIAIVAYAVSEMFDEVFGMAITTILQCFVVDEEMFEADERYAPSSLAGTIDSTQQGYKKSKKVGVESLWGNKSTITVTSPEAKA